MPDAERKADLVLEGGGVKGIGLLGPVLVLAEAGYSFPRVAGTSAGAIVASLVSAYQKAGRDLRGLVEVMNSVQAPGFYARFGYTECGRPPGYPHGHDDIRCRS
jgi:NTE family protein